MLGGRALRARINMNKANKPKVPLEVETLKNDLIWAKYDINEYVIIFGENELQKNMLLEKTGQFFFRLQQMYWDRFSISVSRFTDQHKQKNGNKKLSIYILPELANNAGIDKSNVEHQINNIMILAKAFRTRRSKYIAHRDFQLALNTKDFESDLLYLKNVKEIYNIIGDLLNEFYLKIEDNQWAWDLITSTGARSLIFLIKEALIYQEMKDKRKNNIKDYEEYEKSSYTHIRINNE